MPWIAAVVGAAASAYGAHQQNQAAQRNNQGGGSVDIYHENSPWGLSAPYRNAVMQRADTLWQDQNAAWGAPSGPGAIHQQSAPAGRRGGRGGGGGGGGGRNGQGNVNSQQSRGISLELQQRAENGHPLYDVSTDYTADTLNGIDHNGYRADASADTQRWIDMLFGGQGLGDGNLLGGSGGSGGGGGSFHYGPAGGGGGDAPVGAAKYAKDILDEKYLKEGNPYRSALLDSMTRRIRDEFANTTLPGINSEIGGAGAVGSEAMNQAYRSASQGFTDSLSDAVNQVEYTDYNNRMGDVMHALDTGASLDMNAADNASRNAASAASAYGADRSASTQMQLARMSALQDALGLSAGIASDFGGDQRTALGMVPELSGMDLRDLLGAFGASHSMDELSEQERSAARSAGIARAGVNAQNRAQDFNEWRYMQEAPWQFLGNMTDVVNGASSGYGTSHEYGTDRRNASPMPYSNGWQQAIAGGMAGYGWANQQGFGQQQPAGGYSSYGGPGASAGPNDGKSLTIWDYLYGGGY